MKKISSRPGSAILVVLGMTAFLLVSAIAFSAYMRYSRLPSSYLRRSSSSRLLAKAAMARAIDAVDIAVNNNPHPGVGTATMINPASFSLSSRSVKSTLLLFITSSPTSPVGSIPSLYFCIFSLFRSKPITSIFRAKATAMGIPT